VSPMAAWVEMARRHSRHVVLFWAAAGLLLGPVSPAAVLVAAVVAAALAGRVPLALAAVAAVLAGGALAQARVDALHVPYKGSGPAMTDLIGNHVPMMIETAPASMSHIMAGKLRPLLVTAKERIPTLPEVPTAAEAGLPGFEVSSMFGILAPKGTPQPIIDRLNSELTQILELPDVREKLQQQGVLPTHTSPQEAAQRIDAEIKKWAKVIKEANVTAE